MELHGKNGVASLALWIEFPEKKTNKMSKNWGKRQLQKSIMI